VGKLIVVLDTNIFISSVFWEASPYGIVKKAINQEIIVFISNDIIEEINEKSI
jgi:putative PIN family toxin of toxin-antitoxin system